MPACRAQFPKRAFHPGCFCPLDRPGSSQRVVLLVLQWMTLGAARWIPLLQCLGQPPGQEEPSRTKCQWCRRGESVTLFKKATQPWSISGFWNHTPRAFKKALGDQSCLRPELISLLSDSGSLLLSAGTPLPTAPPA